MTFRVVIPARYASTRLPGKPLEIIGHDTLLGHVYRSASASSAHEVLIATDDERIRTAGESLGARVIMTSIAHQSGTDRINEAVSKLGIADNEIIVNVQGDEFEMPPTLIDQVAVLLAEHPESDMATLCETISNEEVFRNPNTVKVVMDIRGRALYFSRAPVPWAKTGDNMENASNIPDYPCRHVGIYAYRAGFLAKYASLSPAPLEQAESLEQLRALYHGYRIQVAQACDSPGIEINTAADLDRARSQR